MNGMPSQAIPFILICFPVRDQSNFALRNSTPVNLAG